MSLNVDSVLFIVELHMKYTLMVVSLCILLFVLLCDSNHIYKMYCVFAHIYTLDDDLECPLEYELSLLSKVSHTG